MRNSVAAMLGLMAFVLAGCASSGLPYPRWAEVGRQWGCDPLEVQQANQEAHRGRQNGFEYTPEVGWDACELLAKAGEPRDVDMVQTEAGRSYNLYYRRLTGGDTHLVTLEQDDSGVWRVAMVVW